MPANYDLDLVGRTMFVQVSGAITMADIMQLGQENLAHQNWQPGFDLLVDLTATTAFDIDTKDIGILVRQNQASYGLLAGSRCAVVAPSDLVFGLARAWELMSNGQPLTSMIFRTRPQAIAWLGLAQEANGPEAVLAEQRSCDQSTDI